jgi:hypothetical protein
MTRLPQQQRRSSRSISVEVPIASPNPQRESPLSEAPPPPASGSFNRQRILHFPLVLGCSFSLGSFCERSLNAARWAQRFRRSRGERGPALNDCSQSFRAALHLSYARCVPRIGASRGIKIFSRSACMWRYATRRVSRSATMKSAPESRTLAQAASTIVARSGEAKVGAGVTFYF